MDSFVRLLFAGIFLLIFTVQETSSNECIDCTKCRKEYMVNDELPDCPAGCKSDKDDNEFMKMCDLSFRCTSSLKTNVKECVCTYKACTSGGETVTLSAFILIANMVASVSLKYLL